VEPADWSVYVLVSSAGARTYVGVALDLRRRLAQHNGALRGGARSTRAGRPWQLAVSFGPYPSRAQAQRAEALLKRRRGLARLDWDGTLEDPPQAPGSPSTASGKPARQPRV
jgi:predicted GIY-YIG superfamily endonuclease